MTASHSFSSPLPARRILLVLAVTAAVLSVSSSVSFAEDGAHGGPEGNKPKANVNEPGEAVKAPRKTETFAQPGMAPNPIAIDFDPRGNVYVVNAGRAGISVIDNRNSGLRKSNGVINDLQKQTVQDRLEQMNMLEDKGFYPKGIFNKADDKIHFLEDTDGDGVADKTSIFAENFNDKLDGIAAGVLYHEGKVYLTNIPHLWLLEDKDGDGDADRDTEGERLSMSNGYGIRWAFYGHDMHGLIKGHDGRIYWSIGDRGYNVKTREGKTLYGPAQGAVFRMWPDGSGLEVFYEGLRNPQELAFDNYGNLFTGDNNSDSGDKARFIYLPEGGHSGWNQDVQSLRDRGPWNREHMWKPRFAKDDLSQPAWIIPPLKNVGRGPSGLAHYPGVGDAFADNGSFLMCDYPAGVRHVQVQPRGASFTVTEDSSFVNGGTITDVAWGYDGRLYLSDWGGGWKPNPKGYLKTMVNEAAHQEQAQLIAEVKQLFADGFDKLGDEKLIELLGHQDQRVRIHAQWEAAKRTTTRGALLSTMTNQKKHQLHRLHALWALGMKAQASRSVAPELIAATEDPNADVRAQAASILGDIGYTDATGRLTQMLVNASPTVQSNAAIALGKTGTEEHVSPLLDLLDRNANEDVIVRHSASYGLSLIGDADAIAGAAKRKGPAARLGAVLALRRLKSPQLAAFLNDDDPMTAAEAARAIYDMRVMEVMPALAAVSDTIPLDRMSEPVMRRVVEANVRLANLDSAMRLGKLAANTTSPEAWRLLALKELGEWANERNREGVWGWWWPRPEQSIEHAKVAMMTYLPRLDGDKNNKVATQARTLMQQYVAKSSPAELAKAALNPDEPEALRLSTLQMLIQADKTLAVETVRKLALDSELDPTLAQPVRRLLLGLDPAAAAKAYLQALNRGGLAEKQDAVTELARLSDADGQRAFADLARQLEQGKLDAGLRLDVYRALTANYKLPSSVRIAAQKYRQANAIESEAPYIRDAVLAGGDILRGKDLFFNHEAAQCQRCHNIDGSASVGPSLGAMGLMHDASYLYDALVNPSRHIAEGFATSAVRLKNGTVQTGRIVKAKSTPARLVLANADGVESQIERSLIDGIPMTSDQSLMPTMTDKLSAVELRDVLAYLGSLKDASAVPVQTSKAGKSWPYVLSPAKDWQHAIVLPAVLMGITVCLGLLLLFTVLCGPRPAGHS